MRLGLALSLLAAVAVLVPWTVFAGGGGRTDPGQPATYAATTIRSAPPLAPQQPLEYHEFYFTRAIFSEGGRRSWGWGWGGGWDTDYPKADRQFMVVLKRLIDIDASDNENAISLADPVVRGFPFLYMLETGRMRLTDAEVQGLRDYVEAGGFLVVDDIWGPYELDVITRELSRVLPGRQMYELPKDHPLFNNVYDVGRGHPGPQPHQRAVSRPLRHPHARGAWLGDPARVRHRRRPRRAHGGDQLEHRPGRRLGSGRRTHTTP